MGDSWNGPRRHRAGNRMNVVAYFEDGKSERVEIPADRVNGIADAIEEAKKLLGAKAERVERFEVEEDL